MTFIEHIWSHDPPYDLKGEFWNVAIKDAIMPELGVGYHAEAVPAGRAADLDLAREPEFARRPRTAAQRGWGIISANIIPTYSVASHWAVYSKACAELGIPRPRRELAGGAQRHGRALRRRRRTTACSATPGSNRYFFTYIRDVLDRVEHPGRSSSRAPTCRTRRPRRRRSLKECVIYGSPKTVLDKLVAFRERVGPFGTLLMTGLDWGGPNEAWERESMRLLAQEVMPKFRQHTMSLAQTA